MTTMKRLCGLAAVLVLVAIGCAADPMTSGNGGNGGKGGGGGNSGGTGATGAGAASGPSQVLPIPPGPGTAPRPSGTPGGLKVLNWAGFKSAVTYTFDDAQPSQIEHYPDLQAAGVRMTFYITSGGASGAAFDSTFTQAVRDGHEMGNHTVHHCQANLTGCGNGAATSLDAELDDCNSYITGHFGQGAVWTAASPYGDNGYNTPAAARFFINRGVAGGTIGAGASDNTDPFNLPCHGATDGETAGAFNTLIDGADTAGRWLIFLVHTITPTAAVWYAPLPIATITDSIAHARSLGDVWIDSMVNVAAYWRGQKVLLAVAPTTSAAGQKWTWTLPPHFPPGRSLRITFDGGAPSQNGTALPWDPHGYYELALDAGSVTLSP